MDWEAFYNRFRTPDFVPGYEIENRLGGGAFGEVYKARKHSIGKPYAIKFLKIDDDAQREAVERELEQVRHFAAIDHPNLVTIEDLGTVAGVPYLIMGYAGEETLARALRNKTLAPDAALAYFVQACRGVLALHDRRLVHFDLKPSNVFLKGEVARVGDYGLSKMMTEGRMTLSFGRGTPQYMAPEMIRNRADHRADIYSLGVILYESVTGKLPFESPVAGAIPTREDDQPPVFLPETPESVRRVVTRCLRVAPEARYASVADLLVDLGQTARLGESIRFAPPSGAPGAPGPHGGRAAGEPTPRPTPPAGAGPNAAAATGEARHTAAELTRGAVEVARGVWDGLRSTRGPRGVETGPAGGSSQPAAAAHPPPLPGAPEPPPTPRTPVHPSPPEPIGGLVMHTLSSGARAEPDPGLQAPRASFTSRLSPDGATGTIPVPPPAEGGWIGSVAATLQLAMEVLFALVRGLSTRVVHGLRTRRARRTGRRGFFAAVGAFLAGALRLVVFCVALALLGALTVFVFLHMLGGP